MTFDEFMFKFSDQFDETDANDINPDTEFQKLEEWSSLEALCVISMADEEYGKQISADDIRACKTVKELYDFLEK